MAPQNIDEINSINIIGYNLEDYDNQNYLISFKFTISDYSFFKNAKKLIFNYSILDHEKNTIAYFEQNIHINNFDLESNQIYKSGKFEVSKFIVDNFFKNISILVDISFLAVEDFYLGEIKILKNYNNIFKLPKLISNNKINFKTFNLIITDQQFNNELVYINLIFVIENMTNNILYDFNILCDSYKNNKYIPPVLEFIAPVSKDGLEKIKYRIINKECLTFNAQYEYNKNKLINSNSHFKIMFSSKIHSISFENIISEII